MNQGQCLCGAVQVAATIRTEDGIHACHCNQCQRWTGGGPLFVMRASAVEITGAPAIKTYHASAHGERGFCATCGTTLYWKMQGRGIDFLPVGLFGALPGMAVRQEIFVDHRPDWLPPFAGASQSTEAEELVNLQTFLEGQT